MSLAKRTLAQTAPACVAFDVLQLKDIMFRRLFSIRGKPKEETPVCSIDKPEPAQKNQKSDTKNDGVGIVPKEELPKKEQNQEKPILTDLKTTEQDVLEKKDNRNAEKDDSEENEKDSRTEKENENRESTDIKEEDAEDSGTSKIQNDELFSLKIDRSEKEQQGLTDQTTERCEDKNDSGIEGDPCNASSSESDSPTKHKALLEIKRNLDLKDKEKYLESELAHLSPIHLRRMLERKHRKHERVKECCKHCDSELPKRLGSPARNLYRSPDKKRRELAMRPPWQSSYSKRPSFKWDPFSGSLQHTGYPFNRGFAGGFCRGPMRWSSPVKKGILKSTNAAKKVASKNRQASGGKERTRKRQDSETSDSNASSGDETKHMPVRKIFSNQSALRKRIDDLEDMLRDMQEQREQVEAVLKVLEEWAEELRSVDRTKLGVPYIRDVKQVLVKHRQALNNKKSDLKTTLSFLEQAQIPYCGELHGLMEQLNKEVTVIVRDQRKFSAKSVENVRQIQGKLIGMCSAILAVYYDE